MQTIKFRFQGMTLIELLIVLAVLVISFGFIMPGAKNLWQSNTKSQLVNAYFGAFALTRNYAANTREITAICPLDEGQTCVDDWSLPVSIFPDADRDGRPDDNTVWRVIQPHKKGFRVHSRTAGSGSFHFHPDGVIHGTPGSLVICPNEPDSGQMTYLAVNRGGRARQVADADHDGVITLSWGGRITCP